MAEAVTKDASNGFPHLGVFGVLWSGQVISMIGTQLTGFALGVWSFQQTDSVTVYSLFALATLGPQILASPVAGVMIDRWSRKRALITGHGMAGVFSLALACLYLTGLLDDWVSFCQGLSLTPEGESGGLLGTIIPVAPILVLVALSSFFNSILYPAFAAATTLLVPPQHLGRANGLVQLGFALAWIVAPATAGFLMPLIHVGGILLIDVSTFTTAIVATALLPIPSPRRSQVEDGEPTSLWRESLSGLTVLRSEVGYIGLIVFLSVINFNLGMVYVLITPLVLAFADETALGSALSIGGSGMLIGSLILVATPGPKRHRMHVIIGGIAVQGVLLFIGAARPSLFLISAGAFGVLLTIPLIAGYSEVIWQRKIPLEVQGRVFAIKGALVGASLPFAFLLAGPLADKVFEPGMAEGGFLASYLGPVIGVGPGRGVALMFVGLGILTLASTLIGLHPRIRRLETEIPDHDANATGN